MDSLLLLVHRIPYPPDKGDKIRSYHILRALARHYRIYLGAFVDDPDDWRHAESLRDYCERVFLRPLSPRAAKLRSLKGLLTRQALTLPYYAEGAMRAWVREILDKQAVDRVLVYSSSMAQYVDGDNTGVKRYIDFVDIDSDKWAQYARFQSWPMSWVYGREAKYLLAYERQVARRFDYSFFVSRREAEAFQQLSGLGGDKVGFFNNGVDADYFSPRHDLASPYAADEKAIVFTGAMDYWANVDAVTWFADSVLPRLADVPGLRFYIVGSRPTEAVRQLGQRPGIVVTGRVEDVRPYLRHAAMVVAPLRIARGIQNKVLEAMAMGKAVLATPPALEGITARVGKDIVLADTAAAQAEAVRTLLADPGAAGRIGAAARQRILQDYDWERCLDVLLQRLRMTA